MQFETAAAEVLAGLKMKVAGDSGEMVEPQMGEVQILLTSKEDPVSMRLLGVIVCDLFDPLVRKEWIIFCFDGFFSFS